MNPQELPNSRWEHLTPEHREMMEAIEAGGPELRRYYHQRWTDLKNNYSDELPEYDVRDLSPDDPRYNKFKCRGNFITGLGVTVKTYLQHGGTISPETQVIFSDMNSRTWNFSDGKRTSPEEIALINSLLDGLLKDTKLDKDDSQP